MMNALEQWCEMAEQTDMLYLKKFAASLRRHCQLWKAQADQR
jgi:hypothetical protein